MKNNLRLSNEQNEFLLKQFIDYKINKDLNTKALDVLIKKIELIKNIFSNNGNTLAYQNSRIKCENSFLNKINKRYDTNRITYNDMHDIVATRLVCLQLSDVYTFVDLLKNSKNFEILNEKDYIKNPKESGYRSYHIIVRYPVEYNGKTELVTGEIQLRTIFMDIFSREDHKLSYKGSASEKEKQKLKELSNTLYFYDKAIDNLFKVNKNISSENKESLKKYITEYEKISYIYENIYNIYNKKLNKYVSEYKNKDDVLHITSRIKPVSSIKRKLVKRNLSCTTDDMLFNIRDIVGFKIVCIDELTAKDFRDYLVSILSKDTKFSISNISDRFDNPKESGYRGYKMNLTANIDTMNGVKPVTFEIIIRTMVEDSWALHDDKVFNHEDRYESSDYKSLSDCLSGLSNALRNIEEQLLELKTTINGKNTGEVDLVSKVLAYKNKKDREK